MDPSLKVSLINHCIICLKRVDGGGGLDGGEKFEFADSPSFLATFNEFWRILNGDQNNGSSNDCGVGGISLTTGIKAKPGQGVFSEAPTLCQLCGGKVLNADNLLKAVRQQVREVQLYWVQCRKKDGGKSKEFEKHLLEKGLGKTVIQSALKFVGISDEGQGQPIQDKAASDKLKLAPVVNLQRVEVKYIKREPVDIQDEELLPAAVLCDQSMECDEDSNNYVDNYNDDMDDNDLDWGATDDPPRISEPENNIERKAGTIKRQGPLTPEERKKREAERKRAYRARLKMEQGPLSQTERERLPRATEKEEREVDGDGPLTLDKLTKEEERRKREAERKRMRRAMLKEGREKGGLTKEQLKKDEEERKRNAERARARRAATRERKDGPSVKCDEGSSNFEDTGKNDEMGDIDTDNDSDCVEQDDNPNSPNYSISEQEEEDDDDYEPFDNDSSKQRKKECGRKRRFETRQKGRTPQQLGKEKGLKRRKADRERVRQAKNRTPEQLEKLRKQKDERNERLKFRRFENRVNLEAGTLTEEQRKELEESRRKDREKCRLRRAPVGYDMEGKPIYTEKQLERRRKENERMKRRSANLKGKKQKGEAKPLTEEQLERRRERLRRNADKAKFKRIEKQIEGFTPEEIRKHEEYNAMRKEKQRIQREEKRKERERLGLPKRKIDKRTLAKMGVVKPLEILVSLRGHPLDQQQKMG